MVDVCFLLLIYFLAVASIVPRESDLKMALPSRNKVGAQLTPIESMFIRVDVNGFVFSGNGLGEQALDTDPGSRDLPILSSHLQLYVAAADSAGSIPLVEVAIDSGVKQQRVVDVLNAIATTKIRSVTFTDLIEGT